MKIILSLLFLGLAGCNKYDCSMRDPYLSFTNSGHRVQFSNEYHENSTSALEAALENNAPYLEFDVRYTKDKKIVVFHDDSLCPITGKTGSIKRTKYKNLPRLTNGEKIPLFTDFIKLIAENKYRNRVDIHVKDHDEETLNIIKEEAKKLYHYRLGIVK